MVLETVGDVNVSRNREPILRAARREDMADLRSILDDTFESTWRPHITRTAAQTYIQEEKAATYVNERWHLFWVAEIAEKAVGFIDWADDFVDALHVHSAHARQGIGRRLLDHAEMQIASANFAMTRLETDTFNYASQAFYKARGYLEVDRYPDHEWNSGLTTILFVKVLS